MGTDGGTNPENWDEARNALRRVEYFFNENDDFSPEDLHGLEGYELIPRQVRETLENLTPAERDALRKVFRVLEENQFYLENRQGGMEQAY